MNTDSHSDDDEIDPSIARAYSPLHPAHVSKHPTKRLFAAFLLFGLLNNVLYVIILSAALDLVSAETPKGIVALFNIFPALLTKVAWPLISNGKIRYTRRVAFCTACSWLGILTIAFSTSLPPRLLGISLASLSSGMGELTFLQLTTTLPTKYTSKIALGAWASGTGFAGVAGAGIWWALRGLGVKTGLGLSSVLPLFFPVTYTYILPPFSHLPSDPSPYQPLSTTADDADDADDDLPQASPTVPGILISAPSSEYVPQRSPLLSSLSEPQAFDPAGEDVEGTMNGLRLTTKEKMVLLWPLVVRYMLPLCAVYVEEYVINSGVAPTLVFPLPATGVWSHLFKSPRDYYPFWSLTYQSFVFLSRSSLSLGLPPLPRRLLPLPAIIQFLVLSLLFLQARSFIFSSPSYTPGSNIGLGPAGGGGPNEGGGGEGGGGGGGVDRAIWIVWLLICLEGLCGGAGYVNTFYHVNHEGDQPLHPDPSLPLPPKSEAKKAMEREFRIGAVGAADSTGILVASLISMPLEVMLCRGQVEKGRDICRNL
ncbi:protein BTN1 [Cryptococcus wingfieldii CBS 7118]|uniref:Protein BTN n=1 Tax=Cryptococcus wingfieldii CBS 7118 TaxID=1295528 RepID=A0A1E3JZ35_9TREE|nr:protein BTN1 [Cryptococcus wingfieldii CBS 7118]ODO06046.1 protein BTN1 [Cryptococcus wingfieldii CBS 7118]